MAAMKDPMQTTKAAIAHPYMDEAKKLLKTIKSISLMRCFFDILFIGNQMCYVINMIKKSDRKA